MTFWRVISIICTLVWGGVTVLLVSKKMYWVAAAWSPMTIGSVWCLVYFFLIEKGGNR